MNIVNFYLLVFDILLIVGIQTVWVQKMARIKLTKRVRFHLFVYCWKVIRVCKFHQFMCWFLGSNCFSTPNLYSTCRPFTKKKDIFFLLSVCTDKLLLTLKIISFLPNSFDNEKSNTKSNTATIISIFFKTNKKKLTHFYE